MHKNSYERKKHQGQNEKREKFTIIDKHRLVQILRFWNRQNVLKPILNSGLSFH